MALRARRYEDEEAEPAGALAMAMGDPASISRRQDQAPPLQFPGGETRTQEFRDANGNGKDDRDEGPDQSAWNTDGYAKPGYTASNFGNALAGWDQAKWNDPNHQTPKYVVGRILGAAGNLQDPAMREQAITQIMQAYPGTTFNGKDKITIPGVGTVDIFQGAGAGTYGAQFDTGGAPAGMPSAGMGLPMQGGSRSTFIPNDQSTYEALIRRLRQASGVPDGGFDQAGLLSLL